jgi:sarcosine oxidase
MALTYDVIVLGAGGMGSAAAYHAARRGARVLALERFDIPHAFGSSHGLSRIIRFAYWEHPSYVPLVRRAQTLWRDLEQRAGEELLVQTGSIDAAAPGTRPMVGVLDACREFRMAHEVLDGAALRARFPGYRLPDAMTAVFQPEGGILRPERCIAAHVAAARDCGAHIHANERVTRWDARSDRVAVQTDRGTYHARRLVITAGPWLGDVAPSLRPRVAVERQVVAWLKPSRPELFAPERFPVFYLHGDDGSYYGFADLDGRGFKIGKYHHRRELVHPDAVNRHCSAEDLAVLLDATRRYFPDAEGAVADTSTCLFTNTPDEHFLLDVLPDAPAVSIAGGCSGHGFKFCSVVGEILADLALDGGTRHDISLFALRRFDQE